MKARLPLLPIITLFLLPTFSFADVLSFGPLVSTSQIDMPTNYGGFTWGPTNNDGSYAGWIVCPNSEMDAGYGNSYGAPSGGAASSSISPGNFLTSSSPFTFEGADFTSFGINDSLASFSATSITVFAYDAGGLLIGEVSANLSPSGYIFLSADFHNVTRLVFQGGNGGEYADWLMDDFTYIPNTSPPTPPVLTVSNIGSGNMQVVANGLPPSETVYMQTSPDLIDWTTIATNTNVPTSGAVTNIVQTTNSVAFFRLMVP